MDTKSRRLSYEPLEGRVLLAGDPLSTIQWEGRIQTGSDDAEERPLARPRLTSADLELVEDRGPNTIGMRFTDVAIPAGATIESAYLQFQAEEKTSVATSLVIAGEAVDNAQTFSTNLGNISSRPNTAASVAWSPAAWTTLRATGPDQRTPDLAAIIQEIVDRPGWISGSALAIIITGNGERVAYSFEGDSQGAPLLHVEFSSGSTSPNVAPVLDPIGDRTVNERSPLNFTVTASDANEPAQDLTFSLDAASLAAGMTIDPTTGAFSWSPSEAQGPGTFSVTVTARDNGSPPRQDAKTFGITVAEVNGAPVLEPIADQSVSQQSALAFTVVADDPDSPAQNLTFSLDPTSLALGMTIDAGVFRWTTTEAHAPGIFPVTVTVTDSGSPTLQDARSFNITMAQGNSPPVLDPIADRSVDELATLTFTATARDSDAPAQDLTFSLDGASLAAGMTVDATTGVFRWTPAEAHGPGVFTVTVTVTDSGSPNRYDAKTFDITVTEVNDAPPPDSIVPTTIQVRVSSREDDAEEGPSGAVTLTSSDLELVEDHNSRQTVGTRFVDVQIPKGATIQRAYVQFQVDEASSVPTSLTIRADATDNASSFSSTNRNITARSTTDALVTWTPAPWPNVGVAGPDQQTPELAAIIQEIVDRPGWTAGNSLALIINGSGKRTAESYNGVPGAAPLLHVEFTAPVSSNDAGTAESNNGGVDAAPRLPGKIAPPVSLNVAGLDPALLASFDGMEIVSNSHSHVQTRVGRFEIGPNTISVTRAGQPEAVIHFPDNYLADLAMTREGQTTFFSNANVRFSISADAVFRIVFENGVTRNQFWIDAQRYQYSHFQAGAFLGVNEGQNGIYFSPVWSPQAIDRMPKVFNPLTHSFQYSDNALAAAGLKTWNVSGSRYTYDANAGDRFVFGLAYPKDVNGNIYKNVVANTLAPDLITQRASYDYSTLLQGFLASRRGNVAVLNWNTYGNASFGAPYQAANPEAFHEFVNQANARAIEVAVYISPYAFYQNGRPEVQAVLDVVTYFRGLHNNVGVYLDGPIRNDFDATRELLIRTRNLLGENGMIVFHNTENTFGTVVDPLNPANNGLANLAWNAEGIGILRRADLVLNLASSTVTDVIPEVTVDLSGNALSQVDQFEIVLEAGARMRIQPFLNRATGARIAFELDAYLALWEPYKAAF